MSQFATLPIVSILLIMLFSGCTRANSPSLDAIPVATQNLTGTPQIGYAYPAYPSPNNEISTQAPYPYPPSFSNSTPSPTSRTIIFPTRTPTKIPTPTSTPTLFALAKPLPAPLYFISLAGERGWQVLRLERDGSKVTQITHEKRGVSAFDVAANGRLAYLSNNILVVTDARGGLGKVLVRGVPLPTGDNASDENFIQLSSPVWSPDSKLIAFSMGETWLANPASGELIRVTKERSAEQRLGELTYVPVGWTPDGSKIILKIEPPRYGHGGEGPPWGLGFVDPQANAVPINPGTLGCGIDTCEYSILKNGQVLLGGLNSAGLWMIDPRTGQKVSLLPEQDPQKPPNYPTIRWPKQSPDHRILFFRYGGTEATPLMMLAYANEKPMPIPYPKGVIIIGQTDALAMNEALWSDDAQMVLISLGGFWHGNPVPIYQMSALDGKVTQINVLGFNLRWGK
jgi:hypothetical protein